MNNFAKNLRYLRIKNGLSQKELAEKAEITRGAVAAYERKNVQPKLHVLVRLTQIFNTDLNQMLGTDIEASHTYHPKDDSFKKKLQSLRSRIELLKNMLDKQTELLDLKWGNKKLNKDCRLLYEDIKSFMGITSEINTLHTELFDIIESPGENN